MSTTTMKQAPRAQVRDSRGRPVRGLFTRSGRWGMTYAHDGRTRSHMFDPQPMSLSEAKRMRESFTAALREGRTADRSAETFAELMAEWQETPRKRSREGFLSERTRAHEQHLAKRHLGDVLTMRVQAITSRDVARVLATWRRPDAQARRAFRHTGSCGARARSQSPGECSARTRATACSRMSDRPLRTSASWHVSTQAP